MIKGKNKKMKTTKIYLFDLNLFIYGFDLFIYLFMVMIYLFINLFMVLITACKDGGRVF